MSFTKHIAHIIRTSEVIVQRILSGPGGLSPAVDLSPATTSNLYNNGCASSTSLLDIMRDGIMWNTPKHRKTLEKRHREKYGSLHWGNSGRMLRVNKRIRVDYKTGEHFELGKLAPKTYAKIADETSKIAAKISDTFGRLSSRDKEANIIYEGESVKEEDNKLIVRMEKERPTFFSRNLTEKTQLPSNSTSSTTVRPSGLG